MARSVFYFCHDILHRACFSKSLLSLLYTVSPDVSGSTGKEEGAGEGRVPSKVFHSLPCLFSVTGYVFPLLLQQKESISAI